MAQCTKDGYESKESKELAKVTSRLLSEHVAHTGKGQPVNVKTLTSIAWAMGRCRAFLLSPQLIASNSFPASDTSEPALRLAQAYSLVHISVNLHISNTMVHTTDRCFSFRQAQARCDRKATNVDM